jgi:hypothetical protein
MCKILIRHLSGGDIPGKFFTRVRPHNTRDQASIGGGSLTADNVSDRQHSRSLSFSILDLSEQIPLY